MANENAGVVQKLCTVAQLINATMQIQCIVLDLEGKQIYEIPSNHKEKCFCMYLSKHQKPEKCYDMIYTHCKHICEMDDYYIYSCPFDLSNIIFPVRRDGKLIAVLNVGPVMTEDPLRILDNHMSSKSNLPQTEKQAIEESLDAIQQQNNGFVNSLSQTIAILLNQDASLPYMSEILGECDFCSQIYSNTIEAALCFISMNYMNEISLNMVAQSVSLHPARFSKLFSQYTNCSFREYVNRLRVTKAQQLLMDSSKNIATVCCEVGFSDQSHFDKVFKAIVGETPSHFRKEQLAKTDSPE